MVDNLRTLTLSSSCAYPMHLASRASLIEKLIIPFPTRTMYRILTLYIRAFFRAKICRSAILPRVYEDYIALFFGIGVKPSNGNKSHPTKIIHFW
jgi:hypothetical protein